MRMALMHLTPMNIRRRSLYSPCISLYINQHCLTKTRINMGNLLFLSAFFLLSLQLLAQQRTITEKVTDEKGTGLANVSVLIKGSSKGTSPSTDGSYSIDGSPAVRALVFSSVGFS